MIFENINMSIIISQEKYEKKVINFSKSTDSNYLFCGHNICYNKIFPYELKFIIKNNDEEDKENKKDKEDFYISNIKKIILRISSLIDVFSVSLDFFINFYGYTKKDNLIKIPMDFKMFLNNIVFTHRFYVSLHNVPDFITESVIKIKMYDCERPQTDLYIQEIETKTVMTNENKLSIQLQFNLLVKGLFINTNLDNVSNLKLFLNNKQRLNYDDILLHIVCKKISDNLFYLPFDIKQNYTDIDICSYKTSINFSRIDTILLELCIKNIPEYINIYSLRLNIMRYAPFAMGFAFC